MLIAFSQYCKTFKHEIRQHKTPELAFIFTQQYGFEAYDNISELEYTWANAIKLFGITKDHEIPLYDRCYAEKEMRQIWKSFICNFRYKEQELPTVPPLPE